MHHNASVFLSVWATPVRVANTAVHRFVVAALLAYEDFLCGRKNYQV
jgi:hypothetical protein